MLRKRVWIPIVILLLAVIGCGLFYQRQISKQEPVKVYKAVEAEKSETPKPPPPGETAESGHWKPGDVWHAQPHKPVAVSEAETELTTPLTELTKAQSTPVGERLKDSDIETCYHRTNESAEHPRRRTASQRTVSRTDAGFLSHSSPSRGGGDSETVESVE